MHRVVTNKFRRNILTLMTIVISCTSTLLFCFLIEKSTKQSGNISISIGIGTESEITSHIMDNDNNSLSRNTESTTESTIPPPEKDTNKLQESGKAKKSNKLPDPAKANNSNEVSPRKVTNSATKPTIPAPVKPRKVTNSATKPSIPALVKTKNSYKLPGPAKANNSNEVSSRKVTNSATKPNIPAPVKPKNSNKLPDPAKAKNPNEVPKREVARPASKPKVPSKKPHKRGHVDVHLWYNMCVMSLDCVRHHPLFPLWPSVRGTPEMPKGLESITYESWSFQRVMGLLFPTVTGKYRFKIFADSIAEFWLSTNKSPEKVVLIARHNKNVYYGINFTDGRMISESQFVFLNQGQSYYFEILHGVTNNVLKQAKVRIQWMLPGAEIFTGIPKTALSTVIEVDNNLNRNTRKFLLSSSSVLLQSSTGKKARQYGWGNQNFSASFQPYLSITRDSLNTIEFADRWKIMSAFNECDYMPSYVVKKKYKLYEGERYTHFSDVFPDDGTHDKLWEPHKPHERVTGNTFIKESIVVDIVKLFMEYLDRHDPGTYNLANVINVERNVDAKRGDRFLLDLVLLETKTQRLQRLSEYIFQSKNDSDELCKPRNLDWSPNAQINAILTTKNQGPWVIHYIKNMAEIVHATKDDKVHFIVVDYGNNGVDVAEEFRRNNISKFTILKKKGKFHKTLAITDAAKSIKDDNSIVFLTDLHLTAPHNLFESVRKHTIKGIMGYTPVVFRLSHCSRPESEQMPSGFWETAGFGVFSTFKSDWDLFGGVNVQKFKHKWGGEDTEMVDRVLGKGLEIERLRLPQFYHFYHVKDDMWL